MMGINGFEGLWGELGEESRLWIREKIKMKMIDGNGVKMRMARRKLMIGGGKRKRKVGLDEVFGYRR